MLTRRHFIAFVFSGAAFSGCSRRPPAPSPETRHRLYDKAWQWGRRDRLLGVASNTARYSDRLAQHQPAFGTEEMLRVLDKGYEDGFNQHPEEEMGLEESVYDKGYRQGQMDAWAKQPQPPATTLDYRDGYLGRQHRFGRPY